MNRSLCDRGEYLPQESSLGIPAMINYLHSLPLLTPCQGLVLGLTSFWFHYYPYGAHKITR